MEKFELTDFDKFLNTLPPNNPSLRAHNLRVIKRLLGAQASGSHVERRLKKLKNTRFVGQSGCYVLVDENDNILWLCGL